MEVGKGSFSTTSMIMGGRVPNTFCILSIPPKKMAKKLFKAYFQVRFPPRFRECFFLSWVPPTAAPLWVHLAARGKQPKQQLQTRRT